MSESPMYPAPLRRSAFSTLVRFFGMVVIVTGALIIGGMMGYYAAMVAFLSGASDVQTEVYREGTGRQAIAILPIEGIIDDRTVDFVRQAVQAILDSEDVGAVVLRVESPGGSATASDQIHHVLQQLEQADLPVVASYGGYATSGGYYASCDARRIFAEPTTITGSIGVVAPYFTIHKLLDKVGVEPQVVTSSAASEKDMASMLRPWTEQDQQYVRKLLDQMQEQFVSIVAAGRSQALTEAEVRELATGRAFTASEALEAKLIDEIGYLDAALEHAEQLGDFEADEPRVVQYRLRTSGLGGLVGASAGGLQRGDSLSRLVEMDPAVARRWAYDLSIPRTMYLFQP